MSSTTDTRLDRYTTRQLAQSKGLSVRLQETNCTKPIEPQIFGVANSSGGVVVCPNDCNALPIHREYLKAGILQRIQFNGIGPAVISLAETLKPIRQAGEYSPKTFADLQALLQEYRVGDKNSEEQEFLEFKGPKGSYLVDQMLRDAVRAVCAMLNSRDGWVVIGVDDDTGEIAPFPPRYNSEEKPLSVEKLLINVREEINRICPKPTELVHTWPIIDEEAQNCVVINYVHRGDENKHFLYRDKYDDLHNPTKWIRDGPRTIVDPNWSKAV